MCGELESERLLLRHHRADDADAIVALANDWDVAKSLGRLPHPYGCKDAEFFLGKAAEGRAAGTDFNYAVTRKSDRALIGGVGVHLREGGHFEFGYWLGKPYWKQGYATEAARRLISFAFRDLKAERLIAGWFHDNPASGRVLEKLGCVMSGAESRDCLARGHAVYCHIVTLTREDFSQTRKQAEAA
ncbi:MAG TPA: GNAT family N-acetyltransferase [Rhizomicrobium sp.]|jgi:RimJ/RimL family protein N-acetyltransferase